MRTLYNIFLVIAIVFALAVLVYIVVDIIRVHTRAYRIKKKREEAEAAQQAREQSSAEEAQQSDEQPSEEETEEAEQPDEQPPVDEAGVEDNK